MFIDRKEILSLINFCPATIETNRLLAKFGILSGEFNFLLVRKLCFCNIVVGILVFTLSLQVFERIEMLIKQISR
jgi:hypothetical protein